MASNNKILEREAQNNRTFTYRKGGVQLSFTLRVDVKTELKDFIECLEAAQADVQKAVDDLSAK